MDSTHKKRGQGNCPKCNESYFNRYKPKDCSNCGEYIGGSYTSKKKQKLEKPASAVWVTPSIASVVTTNRGNRCFVARDDETGGWICLHGDCKEKRAMHVNSGETKHFTCKHINMAVDNAVPPIKQLHITADEISDYPCSSAVQEKLESSIRYASVNGFAPVVQITETKCAIYAGATASNPLGFCHLEVTEESMSCSGKDCHRLIARGKHKRIKSNCIHMYMYSLATKKGIMENDELEEIQQHEQEPTESELYEEQDAVDANETNQEVSSPRECKIDVALTRQLPYETDKEKIQKILMYDINTRNVSAA